MCSKVFIIIFHVFSQLINDSCYKFSISLRKYTKVYAIIKIWFDPRNLNYFALQTRRKYLRKRKCHCWAIDIVRWKTFRIWWNVAELLEEFCECNYWIISLLEILLKLLILHSIAVYSQNIFGFIHFSFYLWLFIFKGGLIRIEINSRCFIWNQYTSQNKLHYKYLYISI